MGDDQLLTTVCALEAAAQPQHSRNDDRSLLGVERTYPSARRGGRYEQPERPFWHKRASTEAEQVERCRREVGRAAPAGADPNLAPVAKPGAMRGEFDWLVALQMAAENNPE